MRLTPGELKVMQLLWQHGELKPSALQELYPEPIKNSALRSYLSILLDKGHIQRRKVAKAYVYRAKTPQRRAFTAMLGELINTFCEGSTRQLMLTLLRDEQLSAHDLEELQRAATSQDPQSSMTSEFAQRRKRAVARRKSANRDTPASSTADRRQPDKQK